MQRYGNMQEEMMVVVKQRGWMASKSGSGSLSLSQSLQSRATGATGASLNHESISNSSFSLSSQIQHLSAPNQPKHASRTILFDLT